MIVFGIASMIVSIIKKCGVGRSYQQTVNRKSAHDRCLFGKTTILCAALKALYYYLRTERCGTLGFRLLSDPHKRRSNCSQLFPQCSVFAFDMALCLRLLSLLVDP